MIVWIGNVTPQITFALLCNQNKIKINQNKTKYWLPFGKNSVIRHKGFKQTPKNWTMWIYGRIFDKISHSPQKSDKDFSFTNSLWICLIATSDKRLFIFFTINEYQITHFFIFIEFIFFYFFYHLPFQTSPKEPDPINFSKVISVPEIWLTDEFGFEDVTIVQFELFLFGKFWGRAE